MNIRRLLPRAQRLLAGVVLAVSGAYLMIYLYRWEWNRAIISGLFFLAAEVALATSTILRRLQALERRDTAPPAASPVVLGRLRATPVNRPDPFAWLSPSNGSTNVFVPVLLGAGAILSAVAYVVERVAEATAVPVLDRHLASRLSVLTPPTGGLLGTTTPQARVERDRRHRRTPTTVLGTLLAIAAIAVMGWLGVSALLDATQSRPDPADRPARTTIDMAVAQKRKPDGVAEAAEALWVGCRSTLGSLPVSARVVPLVDDRVRLVLEPGIGQLNTRRLTGCLADLKLDLIRADVLDVHHDPPSDRT